jgi:hypothetical protein
MQCLGFCSNSHVSKPHQMSERLVAVVGLDLMRGGMSIRLSPRPLEAPISKERKPPTLVFTPKPDDAEGHSPTVGSHWQALT